VGAGVLPPQLRASLEPGVVSLGNIANAQPRRRAKTRRDGCVVCVIMRQFECSHDMGLDRGGRWTANQKRPARDYVGRLLHMVINPRACLRSIWCCGCGDWCKGISRMD
jgi:hypothetical protein